MKTISDYSIYCSEEQTRKALELGAPIITTSKEASMFFCAAHPKTFISKGVKNSNKEFTCAMPTAEQMISWLEEQKETSFDVYEIYNGWTYNIIYGHSDANAVSVIHYDSRKEATLAAIDAALEYLTNNKK